MLMNPGPEMSILPNTAAAPRVESVCRSCITLSATSFGFIFNCFASDIATMHW